MAMKYQSQVRRLTCWTMCSLHKKFRFWFHNIFTFPYLICLSEGMKLILITAEYSAWKSVAEDVFVCSKIKLLWDQCKQSLTVWYMFIYFVKLGLQWVLQVLLRNDECLFSLPALIRHQRAMQTIPYSYFTTTPFMTEIKPQ